jgi:hypothetical protein
MWLSRLNLMQVGDIFQSQATAYVNGLLAGTSTSSVQAGQCLEAEKNSKSENA